MSSLALTLIAGLLVIGPAPAGSAAPGAGNDQTTLRETAALELPEATPADREPAAVPADLNNVDVTEFTPRFKESTTPIDSVDTSASVLGAGAETLDAFALDSDSGDHLAIVYPSAVNEENADGEWIDLDLDPSRDGASWTMMGPDWSVDVPLRSKVPVTFENPWGRLTSSLEGVDNVRGAIQRPEVWFENVFASTDRVIAPTPGGYREDLVLRTPEAPLTFAWSVQADGLTLAQQPNGTIALLTAEGTHVSTIGTPTVYDSADPANILGLTWSLSASETDSGAAHLLSASIDPAWAASATYPLILDPGTANKDASHDAYTSSIQPNQNFGGASTLEVGPNYRTFIRFPLSVRLT